MIWDRKLRKLIDNGEQNTTRNVRYNCANKECCKIAIIQILHSRRNSAIADIARYRPKIEKLSHPARYNALRADRVPLGIG